MSDATITLPKHQDTPVISEIRKISKHAVQRFYRRVDDRPGTAHAGILRMWRFGHNATDYELNRLGMYREPFTTYRICESCYGKHMLLMRQGEIVTLWELFD